MLQASRQWGSIVRFWGPPLSWHRMVHLALGFKSKLWSSYVKNLFLIKLNTTESCRHLHLAKRSEAVWRDRRGKSLQRTLQSLRQNLHPPCTTDARCHGRPSHPSRVLRQVLLHRALRQDRRFRSKQIYMTSYSQLRPRSSVSLCEVTIACSWLPRGTMMGCPSPRLLIRKGSSLELNNTMPAGECSAYTVCPATKLK